MNPFLKKIFTEEKPSHDHDWKPTIKTVIEPKNVSIPGDATLTRLALTGATIYWFQCTVCHELRKEQAEGVEETALERLLDKVDVGGPEYILRNGKTYILMKRPDQLENLPVRSVGS